MMTDHRYLAAIKTLVGCGLLSAHLYAAAEGPRSGGFDDCPRTGQLETVCGLHAPEDIADLVGTPYLVVSLFGGMDGSAGGLALLDTASRDWSHLLEPGAPLRNLEPTDGWGDPSCQREVGETLSPHGIDIAQRDTGETALLVVNHGRSETIELFHLQVEDDGLSATWRGCVDLGPRVMLNDVVATSDNGFYTTSMFDQTAAPDEGLNTQLRQAFRDHRPSGHVLHWAPGEGVRVVPGTSTPAPNGLELSLDETALYLNVYPLGEVRKIDLQSGDVMASATLEGPDNLAWGDDGYLYVAGHFPAFQGHTEECSEYGDTSCPYRFQIHRIDPETMAAELMLDYQGEPFGAATVALRKESVFYMGSFTGTRLGVFKAP